MKRYPGKKLFPCHGGQGKVAGFDSAVTLMWDAQQEGIATSRPLRSSVMEAVAAAVPSVVVTLSHIRSRGQSNFDAPPQYRLLPSHWSCCRSVTLGLFDVALIRRQSARKLMGCVVSSGYCSSPCASQFIPPPQKKKIKTHKTTNSKTKRKKK